VQSRAVTGGGAKGRKLHGEVDLMLYTIRGAITLEGTGLGAAQGD